MTFCRIFLNQQDTVQLRISESKILPFNETYFSLKVINGNCPALNISNGICGEGKFNLCLILLRYKIVDCYILILHDNVVHFIYV